MSTPNPGSCHPMSPPHRRALRHTVVLPMARVLEQSKEEWAYPQTHGINTPKPCLRHGGGTEPFFSYFHSEAQI